MKIKFAVVFVRPRKWTLKKSSQHIAENDVPPSPKTKTKGLLREELN